MTQHEPVNIGIIGVGQIGKRHIERHSKIAGANIIAIADVNEAEAKRVADEYGIPNVYTDFRALLQRDDLVAVDVCLHNNLHMPVTVAALEAGKHVYCEKPMAGSYIDAQTMLEASQRTGQKLHIQLRRIFNAETKAARQMIDNGKLGRVFHARSAGFRRRGRPFVDGYGTERFVQKEHASGGAIYDMGVYHISRMLYLLDNPDVLTISGKIYQETPMDEARRAQSNYDVEELGMGFVRLGGDITLDVMESWAVHLDTLGPSYINGSEGGVSFNPLKYFFSTGDLNVDGTIDTASFDRRRHLMNPDEDVYDSPEDHWIAALQGRVDLLPTAEIALNTMLISEGIYLSSERGSEVTAAEVRSASPSTAMKF